MTPRFVVPLALFLCVALPSAVLPSAVLPSPVSAQSRLVRIEMTPTQRVQLAIWVESDDGVIFTTLFLTDAVAYRGIGNRPGALQMNSAWHWPWGRREGALPVWAHRRSAFAGNTFERVIFSGRNSEGFASVSGDDVSNTRDEYYCLSFTAGDEGLDTVSCASVFMSNKGRYLDASDVSSGYSEPWEDAGAAPRMRGLGLGSLYPPRQDLADCGTGCSNHDNVGGYIFDARAVMPELDAVTMATLPGDTETPLTDNNGDGVPDFLFSFLIDVPDEWPDGSYTLFIEANTEGDHGLDWNTGTYPTPVGPTGRWDTWAIRFGYPYRGQPSVVYEVPFEVGNAGGVWTTSAPSGYSELHGLDGDVRPIGAPNSVIVDLPEGLPGSGADRLRCTDGTLAAGEDCAASGGFRVRVEVPTINVCDQPDAPPECGAECGVTRPCDDPLICGPEATCVGICDIPMEPSVVTTFEVASHTEERLAHIYAHLSFEVPASGREIDRYEVRVSTAPITDLESFRAGRPAKAASLEDMALTVPTGDAVGTRVAVDLGGLSPETSYWVGIRAFDTCNSPSEVAVTEVETTEIFFTTVSPCFVSTAAFGHPMDQRIGALRRFRDRHLRPNAVGRAVVAAYHALGPYAAAWIADDEDRRAGARGVLGPVVAFAEWLER